MIKLLCQIGRNVIDVISGYRKAKPEDYTISMDKSQGISVSPVALTMLLIKKRTEYWEKRFNG